MVFPHGNGHVRALVHQSLRGKPAHHTVSDDQTFFAFHSDAFFFQHLQCGMDNGTVRRGKICLCPHSFARCYRLTEQHLHDVIRRITASCKSSGIPDLCQDLSFPDNLGFQSGRQPEKVAHCFFIFTLNKILIVLFSVYLHMIAKHLHRRSEQVLGCTKPQFHPVAGGDHNCAFHAFLSHKEIQRFRHLFCCKGELAPHIKICFIMIDANHKYCHNNSCLFCRSFLSCCFLLAALPAASFVCCQLCLFTPFSPGLLRSLDGCTSSHVFR